MAYNEDKRDVLFSDSCFTLGKYVIFVAAIILFITVMMEVMSKIL